ncbi:MAG: FAD-binding oxidoreductase [Candidatus Freyarchaeota archaeon]|nr:FAD-binding oxidoreductase [Candidatus Freyrarchaeum guaymaensis]
MSPLEEESGFGKVDDEVIEKLVETLGRENVKTDVVERYVYSSDASLFSSLPDVVVIPETTEQVSGIMRIASEKRIPVTPRGAGTGLCGGAVPLYGGIVVDLSRMNRILEVDPDNFCVTVEAGIIPEELNKKLSEHGVFFPPSPGSKKMCTIGGMISTNAGGMHAVKYGVTRSFVLGLRVVLPSGEILKLGGKTLKRCLGYDLLQLFIGSEGTLGIITEATLRVLPIPEMSAVAVAYFQDISKAARAVNTVLRRITPSAIEILDGKSIEAVNRYMPSLNLPQAEAALYFEVEGGAKEVERQIKVIVEACKELGGKTEWTDDPNEKEKLLTGRELVGGAIMNVDRRRVRIYEAEDVCVPLSKLPAFIREVHKISEKYGIPVCLYGHAGDGNCHSGIMVDPTSREEWEKMRHLAREIYELAVKLGGNISGEHGIGILRAEYMERIHGATSLRLMRAIKRAFDPLGILNPGKMGL